MSFSRARAKATLALLGVLAGGLWTPHAAAQACCSAGSVVTPGRLALGERVLVGAQPQVSASIGSFDAERGFRSSEAGSNLIDWRTTLFGTLRVVNRVQVGVTIPTVVSFRKSRDAGTEVGGGIGDVAANLRYDVLFDSERPWWPGIGLLAGISAPTGRGPAESKKVLASDVTGLGVWQWSGGIWLERTLGRILLSGAGLVAFRSRAEFNGLKSQLAPQYTGLVSLGYAATDSLALALVTTYSAEGQASLGGDKVPSTGRTQTRVSLGASWSPSASIRLMANGFFDPPLSGLSKNQVAQAGGGVTLVWAFSARASQQPAVELPPCHQPGHEHHQPSARSLSSASF